MCLYCDISENEISWDIYYQRLDLYTSYVNEGIFKFLGGDSELENIRETIDKELQYTYHYYFMCNNCGNHIRLGACIRSSVALIEHIEK